MNRNSLILIAFVCYASLLISCSGSRYSCKSRNSKVAVALLIPKTDVIDFTKITSNPQVIPKNFASRGSNRGLDPASSAIQLATQGVESLIAMDNKKYVASYSDKKTNYFYDQPSVNGPLDPLGLQFKGFSLLRTFKDNDKIDTAIYFVCELDTSNPLAIINNSFFRLRLKDLKLNYAQAKVPSSKWYLPWTLFQKDHDDKVNVDVNITFKTSYFDSEGVFNNDVTLGTFLFILRDFPLNPADTAGRERCRREKIDSLLDGECFIVPRSFGHYYGQKNNMLQDCWNQGEYNINVNVNESGKQKFIIQAIQNNAPSVIKVLETPASKITTGSKTAKGK